MMGDEHKKKELDKIDERALEVRIEILEEKLLKLLEETETEEGKNSIPEMCFYIREAIENARRCYVLGAIEYLSNAGFYAGIYKQAEKLSEKSDRYEKLTKTLFKAIVEVRDILESKCGCPG
jgi:hypothetical protein